MLRSVSRLTRALGLLIACASAAVQAQVLRQRDPVDPSVERRCQAAVWPKKLPALDAVLDSAALSAALAGVADTDTTSVSVGILYREGQAPIAHLARPDSIPAVGPTLLDLVSRALRPLPSAPRLGALRVRLHGQGHREVAVERSVYCPPQQVGPGGPIGTIKVQVPATPGDRMPSPGQRIPLEAQSAGRVLRAEFAGALLSSCAD